MLRADIDKGIHSLDAGKGSPLDIEDLGIADISIGFMRRR